MYNILKSVNYTKVEQLIVNIIVLPIYIHNNIEKLSKKILISREYKIIRQFIVLE